MAVAKGARELLEELKADPQLKGIRVITFTDQGEQISPAVFIQIGNRQCINDIRNIKRRARDKGSIALVEKDLRLEGNAVSKYHKICEAVVIKIGGSNLATGALDWIICRPLELLGVR